MNMQILTPAAVLVLWSIVMLVWMGATRLPALKRAGVDMSTAVGGRGQDLETVLPPSINWKAHNYAHLMEQPTIFYATVAILAITGAGGGGYNIALAWAYAGLRIAHSMVQATVNRISLRFPIFAMSSVVLLILAINAFAATL